MAQFNMPLHVQTPEDEYIMDDHYHDNGMTSPHELGTWMDDQSDGGGKFRLKRRRRCGQCGPCQVKENCGKCQYCVRKDILKQACIYRKCVYLRKPVPRFRPDAAGSSSSNSSGGGAGGVGAGAVSGGSSSSNSTNKGSPQKPSSTPSAVSNHHSTHPTPSPFNPSAMAAAAAAAQSAELSSCQITQNPFGLPMNNGVIDPLRASALDQHRSALFDATGMLDPTRTSYLSGARGLDSGRSPALDLGRNSSTADSGFGTNSSLTTSPASSVTKDRPLPHREQFRSPMEQWGAMPYGFPRANPWAHPALQPNPAAAYGFQPSANHYANPFGSSCRLGMTDPAGHLAGPSQPAFHHNMPFARPDFSAHANFRASAPSMQPTMTPPFYPPPPHIPSSLPNFPSFNQLPSSAGPHGTYPMAHPPMYPSNFYSSFRPPNEPQIYHAHLTTPDSPFSRPYGFLSGFPSFLGKHLSFDKGDKDRHSEEDDELKKKFSIFCIPSCKRVCDLNSDDCAPIDLTTEVAAERTFMQKDVIDLTSLKEKNSSNMLLKVTPVGCIDEDLQQQMKRISRRGECDVISIDDFKMQAFIRSDGFNNLEIEIDSPTIEAAFSKAQHPLSPAETYSPSPNSKTIQDQEDMNNNSISEKEGSDTETSCSTSGSSALTKKTARVWHTEHAEGSDCAEPQEDGQRPSDSQSRKGSSFASLSHLRRRTGSQGVFSWESDAISVDQRHNDSRSHGRENVSRTLLEDVVVCLIQEGEDGVTELEVPGVHVQLEEVPLHDDIISSSSDPQDLLRFISQHAVVPRSPDLVFDFNGDHSDDLDFDPEDLS